MAKLRSQLVQNWARYLASFVEVDRERQLHLAAIASRGQVCGAHDEAAGPLPQKEGDVGVQQATRCRAREQVPSQVALFRRAASVHEDADLCFAEAVLLLQHR